ncbi:MAG: heavy metal translocating P-type ATPase, partial [Ruminococcus bromii]|nr:heavy metal translocating P-type ATPase [Ruminococcus bromii]
DYVEGIAVMLFYQIGELFQSYAVGKSRKNISALMDIRPDYANIEADGQLTQVDPDEVAVGSIIVVQPGEKVPLDGVVVEGAASLNTSALTGESLPRDVKEGDEIISGCIDMSGVLKIRTTKAFGESTVSKILDLVENASSRKSRSEAFISRFAKVYTPAVCAAALALAVLVPLGRMLAGLDANWTDWVYRALSFLVVSCPCALVISIPLSFFAGIGGASREGVLIKGSNYLEALSEAKIVVFDKTGTLTQGVFEVTAVHHSLMDEAQLLEYAALAECASSHPISKSLQKAYGKEIDRSRVTDIEELSGHGITATVDGHAVAAGNSKLMKKLGIEYHDCHSTGTIIHMAVDGRYAGHIVISDIVKPHSKEALEQLKRAGVRKTVMLTGDAKRVADSVAAGLGVDEVRSELLPGDKVAEVEKLLAAKGKNEMLAFVGDGINDAPVLTRADTGIAMGAMGSDAAIEAADIVLMDDDLLQIAKAIQISRKCIGIVRQNIVFSLVVKFGCLALVAFGAANMWAAIFADVGVMVLAVLNAIRALNYKN